MSEKEDSGDYITISEDENENENNIHEIEEIYENENLSETEGDNSVLKAGRREFSKAVKNEEPQVAVFASTNKSNGSTNPPVAVISNIKNNEPRKVEPTKPVVNFNREDASKNKFDQRWPHDMYEKTLKEDFNTPYRDTKPFRAKFGNNNNNNNNNQRQNFWKNKPQNKNEPPNKFSNAGNRANFNNRQQKLPEDVVSDIKKINIDANKKNTNMKVLITDISSNKTPVSTPDVVRQDAPATVVTPSKPSPTPVEKKEMLVTELNSTVAETKSVAAAPAAAQEKPSVITEEKPSASSSATQEKSAPLPKEPPQNFIKRANSRGRYGHTARPRFNFQMNDSSTRQEGRGYNDASQSYRKSHHQNYDMPSPSAPNYTSNSQFGQQCLSYSPAAMPFPGQWFYPHYYPQPYYPDIYSQPGQYSPCYNPYSSDYYDNSQNYRHNQKYERRQ